MWGCGVIRLACLFPGLVLLLVACSATRPIPEDRFYQLDIGSQAVPPARPLFDGRLEVASVTADPLRSGRAVVYRENRRPLEVRRYHYEFWVEQPPRMVHRALLDQLGTNGVGAPLPGSRLRGHPGYTLKAHLKRFEQLVGAGLPQVEIELQASVYENGSGQPLWSNSYLRRRDSQAADMHATAAAMEICLAEILHAVVEDLAALDIGR